MHAKLAYVCFKCQQIFERAPMGVCQCCGSERIAPVTALMHPTRVVESPRSKPSVIDAWFAARSDGLNGSNGAKRLNDLNVEPFAERL